MSKRLRPIAPIAPAPDLGIGSSAGGSNVSASTSSAPRPIQDAEVLAFDVRLLVLRGVGFSVYATHLACPVFAAY